MRVLVIAAGDGTRWGNYLGVPKHLAELGGERILDRTARQVAERGHVAWVVGPPGDLRYLVPRSQLAAPVLNASNGDADKFLSSAYAWSRTDRTVILYGDVWFTDEAMDTILGYPGEDWRLFARLGPSAITGTPYGECFAFSFGPGHRSMFTGHLWRLGAMWRAGKIPRCGGWELYRSLSGQRIHETVATVPDYGNVTNIDDLTDDVDYPADHLRLAAAIECR